MTYSFLEMRTIHSVIENQCFTENVINLLLTFLLPLVREITSTYIFLKINNGSHTLLSKDIQV